MNHPHRDRLTSLQQVLLSRRTLLRGALGTSVAGLLAACGGDAGSEPASSPQQSATEGMEPTAVAPAGATSTERPAQSSGTLTVENEFGLFEAPVDPQRVVGWEGRRDLETALALGLSPIAIGDNALTDGELAPFIPESFKLDGVEIISQIEPDLELIASLRPDLILTRDSNIAELVDRLRPIAPLVPVRADGPWRPDLEGVASALGRADRVSETLATYDALRDEVRARHGERISSATVAVIQYGGAGTFWASSTTGFYLQANTLADLGGKHLPFLEKGGAAFENEGFSIERIGELAETDAIVLITSSQEYLSELESFELWQGLPAVESGQIVTTDWRTNYGSVYAATECLRLLDELYQTFPASTTIEHKFGVTEIPEEPQRVVALGFSDQDPVLALGVKPIAIRYWFGEEPYAVFPWAQDELGDAEPEVLNMPELDIEQIAALQPDLIIGTYSGITEGEYQTLSRITPTIAQSGDYIDYGMPWQETTLTIGQALGRAEQARELVAEVEAQFEAAREAHPEWAGKSVVLISGPDADGQYGFFASEDPRSRVFTSLGFVVPAELDKLAGDQFYGTISAERLELFDRDLLVWNQLQWVEGGRAAIEAEPLVQQLTAMQEGRAVFIGGELDDALQFGTVLSLPFLLEGLVPMLEAAMDGDPTTEATP